MVVGPVRHEGRVFPAERQHSTAEFVEVESAAVTYVHTAVEQVNVVAIELIEEQVLLEAVDEVLRCETSKPFDVKHSKCIHQVEV